MKFQVQKSSIEYKNQSGKLSSATMDRAENALTYRIFGCEKQNMKNYEHVLSDYEQSAVKANIFTGAISPLYRVICMSGTAFILYFGAKNVLGTGWIYWDISIFTTFLSCYTRLAVKSSKAAKLFNSIHRAQISWKRIQPFMYWIKDEKSEFSPKKGTLKVQNLNFSYPDSDIIFRNISFTASPGQIIGITGPVACGKSTLAKTFLCEYPYSGSIKFADNELSSLSSSVLYSIVGYLGHNPELLNDSIKNNILMGDNKNIFPYIQAVCLDKEISQMDQGMDTIIGNGGIRLSGGQAKRVAIARTLCHKKPVLILDDPFSALDRETEDNIFKNIKKLTKENILLLFSHRLYLFPQLDQIIWMQDKTAVVSTHNELIKTSPSYRELYRIQTERRSSK